MWGLGAMYKCSEEERLPTRWYSTSSNTSTINSLWIKTPCRSKSGPNPTYFLGMANLEIAQEPLCDWKDHPAGPERPEPSEPGSLPNRQVTPLPDPEKGKMASPTLHSLGVSSPPRHKGVLYPHFSVLAGLHSHLWKWHTAQKPPTRKSTRPLCPGLCVTWSMRRRPMHIWVSTAAFSPTVLWQGLCHWGQRDPGYRKHQKRTSSQEKKEICILRTTSPELPLVLG